MTGSWRRRVEINSYFTLQRGRYLLYCLFSFPFYKNCSCVRLSTNLLKKGKNKGQSSLMHRHICNTKTYLKREIEHFWKVVALLHLMFLSHSSLWKAGCSCTVSWHQAEATHRPDTEFRFLPAAEGRFRTLVRAIPGYFVWLLITICIKYIRKLITVWLFSLPRRVTR